MKKTTKKLVVRKETLEVLALNPGGAVGGIQQNPSETSCQGSGCT